jgi:hypothetical protein
VPLCARTDGDAGLVVFLSELFAERRWVMTGTPTTGDDNAADDGGRAHAARGLDQLQTHLRFLRHPAYGRAPSAVAAGASPSGTLARNFLATLGQWATDVKEPFLRGEPHARQRLEQLLRGLVVMHRKEDVALPKPILSVTELSVSLPEAAVADVRATVAAQGYHAGAVALAAYLATDAFQTVSDRACALHVHAKLTAARLAWAEGAPRLLPGERKGGLADRRPVKCVVYSSSEADLLSTCAQLDADVQFRHVAQFNSHDGRCVGRALLRVSPSCAARAFLDSRNLLFVCFAPCNGLTPGR